VRKRLPRNTRRSLQIIKNRRRKKPSRSRELMKKTYKWTM
jgi:hypothetical protein